MTTRCDSLADVGPELFGRVTCQTRERADGMPRTHRELERSAEVGALAVRALAEGGDSDLDDLYEIVAAVGALAAADRSLIRAVQVARDHGQSWPRIARALGTSKQSAIERYSAEAVQSGAT